MDLPGLPSYDDVTSTLGISEQEDVMAVIATLQYLHHVAFLKAQSTNFLQLPKFSVFVKILHPSTFQAWISHSKKNLYLPLVPPLSLSQLPPFGTSQSRPASSLVDSFWLLAPRLAAPRSPRKFSNPNVNRLGTDSNMPFTVKPILVLNPNLNNVGTRIFLPSQDSFRTPTLTTSRLEFPVSDSFATRRRRSLFCSN
jgi:hypothetical protein